METDFTISTLLFLVLSETVIVFDDNGMEFHET